MNAQEKVIIVTGSNAGIGKATALRLAQLGATVVMVVRNLAAGAVVQQAIIAQTGNTAVDLLPCDLSSQASIRSFAAEFTRKYARLDGLINNAANFDHRLKRAAFTTDGVEVVFATNHLGPFLLTHLLLSLILQS